MSERTNQLVVGGTAGMETNNNNLLDASQPVTSVQVGDGTNSSLNIAAAANGSASGHHPESLALNLNLALESDPLSTNHHHTTANNNSSSNRVSAGGKTPANTAAAATAAALAAANSTSTASTAMNSNSNTTIPTPVMEGGNPGSTNSAGLTGAYPSMNSIPSASPSRAISNDRPIPNDRSNNMLRMFQRMDELSARFIVMEEMFQKLCKTVEQQSLSMADLKLQNSQMSQDFNRKLDAIYQQERHYGKQPNDQDSFVTDLLNSITNVSSSYLRKIRSRSRPGSVKVSPPQQGITPNTGQWSQYDQTASAQHLPQTQSNSVPCDKTFTLNPNGIKRRRHNPAHSNGTNGAPSYTDLSSLNNLGTISLPNLALDHTGITPLIRNGANGGNNGSLGFPTQSSLEQQQHPQFHPSSRGRGIHLEIGSEFASANEDEDGYQEEDEDDNNSRLAKTDSSSEAASSSSEEASAEEEDEADDEIDNATKENNGNGNLTSRPKRKRSKLTDQDMRNLIGNSDEVSIRNTPDRNERLVLKNSRSAMSQLIGSSTDALPNDINNSAVNKLPDSHDRNYTLLKAPTDVRTIWKEYVSGIGGDPPIKKLEEKYGNKWRLNHNRKTFARRKRLYKFIINGMNKGRSADEMIDDLERRRLYRDENGEVKRRTIGWLQQSLTGI